MIRLDPGPETSSRGSRSRLCLRGLRRGWPRPRRRERVDRRRKLATMPIVATLVTRIDPATDSVADEIFTPLIGVSATASFDTLAVLALAAVLLVRAPNPDCLLPLHERHRLQPFRVAATRLEHRRRRRQATGLPPHVGGLAGWPQQPGGPRPHVAAGGRQRR